MVASLWQQNSIKGLLTIIMALVAIIWVREKSCLWKLNELMLFKMTQTSQHKKMSYTSSMFRFHWRARRVAKCWQPGPVCCVHQCPDCPACSTSTEYLMSATGDSDNPLPMRWEEMVSIVSMGKFHFLYSTIRRSYQYSRVSISTTTTQMALLKLWKSNCHTQS